MSASAEVPRYEIAEQALKEIEDVLDGTEGSDWSQAPLTQEVRSVVDIADAKLRMVSRRRRRPGACWLAKEGSFAYPRKFDGWWGDDPDPHMCVQIEITDGPKAMRDRYIEIQMPDDDMERLARQMLDIVGSRKKAKGGKS